MAGCRERPSGDSQLNDMTTVGLDQRTEASASDRGNPTLLLRLRAVAKRLLAVGWIRTSYELANRVVLEVFGTSRILVHLLFAAVPFTFNREQVAVLRGRRNYYRNKHSERRSHVELRRNIHRLEKGLIMLPRRRTFAIDFIAETMEFYARAAEQGASNPESLDNDEIQWAHDVLEAYFDACVDPHPVIDAARARFAALPWAGGNQGKAPTSKATRGRSEISYEQLLELARQRRSVRFFDRRPVQRGLIDQALAVACQAPSACNRMPYEFRVFDDPAKVREVVGLPFGAVGYSHQIPAVAVLIGKLDNYFSPRDRHAIYVDGSLAAMSFLFALETLGLSSSVINWPDFEPLERRMQRLLGLDLTERVVMLIAFGYAHPDALVPYSQKKQLDTFRSYNQLAK
jgi:nitroreductase